MFHQIAYAIDTTGQGGQQGFGMFIPLIILGLIFGFFLRPIAKRKGKSQPLYFALAFLPVVNFLAALWLVSLPDTEIMEKLDSLIKELQKIGFALKNSHKSAGTPMEEYWTCTCGEVNKMDVANCPICGLKRNFLLKKTE